MLAATEIDRELANKVLNAGEDSLPLFKRHFVGIVFKAPIFTIATIDVATLVNQASRRSLALYNH